MEPVETPLTEDINILTSENSKPKKFDAQQYFLDSENNEENNDQTEIIVKDQNKCCGISCLIFLILAMLGITIPLFINYLKTDKSQFITLTIVAIIFFVFFIFLILMSSGKKYVFSKNIQKNKFYIKD